ncbi:MAG: hypothetical protein HZA93_04220 [Verrucomicrobia bacterium]|nr:hypothetical protein [Verrucomicrobiota bacterium]
MAVFATLLGGGLAAQEARVRPATEVSMPRTPDSNSPAFWRDGRLFWFGSHGSPWLSAGPDQFGPWDTRAASVPSPDSSPKWIEAVWPDSDGVIFGWYHAEPVNLIAESTLTAPKVGAAVSFDGGYTMNDLGFILESGDPIDPTAQNGYFAGGHGDCSAVLDRSKKYFYFFFGNYGGAAETQGVCVARMAYEDRHNPSGKVWKYHNGAWQEAGRGGRVTPIFPVRKAWASRYPDAFWGPSVHWNTHLNCYVMLLNRAAGVPSWGQEGVYVSFCADLTKPETWSEPRKVLDRAEIGDPGSYYPQVMGLESGGTDRWAGETARLYVRGVSKWEIDFVAPETAPTNVEASITPASGEVKAGEFVTLGVTAMGLPPFTYQWAKDGVALPAATAVSHLIAGATANDAGRYSVVVTNSLGEATSNTVTLSVQAAPVAPPTTPTSPVAPGPTPAPPPAPAPAPTPAPVSYLSNLSVRAMLAPGQGDLTVGFSLKSRYPKPLLIRAVGPSLTLFGVADAAQDPRLQLFDGRAVQTAENDNWLPADAAVFAAAGAFPLLAGSMDAALVAKVPAGPGTARVTSLGGGVVLVEIYDADPEMHSKVVNLSVRTLAGPGAQALMGGFSVTGGGPKRVLIRALGPQLAAFGVTNALPDPAL